MNRTEAINAYERSSRELTAAYAALRKCSEALDWARGDRARLAGQMCSVAATLDEVRAERDQARSLLAAAYRTMEPSAMPAAACTGCGWRAYVEDGANIAERSAFHTGLSSHRVVPVTL